MRKSILGVAELVIITIAITIISWKPISAAPHNLNKSALLHEQARELYDDMELLPTGLQLPVFEKAMVGFYNLKDAGKLSPTKSILSIADFDQSSTTKRLWIVDLEKKALVLNTWVAHGEFSGWDRATEFSNTIESQKSSIGFYVTGEPYYGKHGLSLKLDGMDEGFNSNARKRLIVIHGANYVSQQSINALGRLGRSQGCPAVPQQLVNTIVKTMENKTVLFINVSDPTYNSKYLDPVEPSFIAKT